MARQIGVSQQVLPLDVLIAGPLQAVVDAHAVVSQASLRFVEEFGVENPPQGDLREDGSRSTTQPNPEPPLPHNAGESVPRVAAERVPPKLRMVEFSYHHPVPDPANPGNVIDTPTTVRVPLLALVSPPSLSIDKVNLDFSVSVLGFTPAKNKPTETNRPNAPVDIQATYSPRSASPSDRREPPGIQLSVTMARTPLAEGATRVLSLLQDAIVSRPTARPSERDR